MPEVRAVADATHISLSVMIYELGDSVERWSRKRVLSQAHTHDSEQYGFGVEVMIADILSATLLYLGGRFIPRLHELVPMPSRMQDLYQR